MWSMLTTNTSSWIRLSTYIRVIRKYTFSFMPSISLWDVFSRFGSLSVNGEMMQPIRDIGLGGLQIMREARDMWHSHSPGHIRVLHYNLLPNNTAPPPLLPPCIIWVTASPFQLAFVFKKFSSNSQSDSASFICSASWKAAELF